MEWINSILPSSDSTIYNQLISNLKSFISNSMVNVVSVINLSHRMTSSHKCCATQQVSDVTCGQLLDCTRAPKWTQEPFVTGGYLPQHQYMSYYFRALYIRNYELMNIWTNLIPLFLYIYMLLKFNQEMDLVESWPLLIIICSSIICMICSAFAHLFHSKSETWHRNCFLLDYFGIMMYASCSSMANWFASSTLYHYNFMKSSNLPVLMSIANTGFLCMAATKMDIPILQTPMIGRVVKVGVSSIGYIYGMTPVFYRIFTTDICSEVRLYHSLQFIFMLCNPLLFTSDFPQKYWPGKFNTFLHSHQLFHISVALSCFFNILAIHRDVTLADGMFHILSKQPDYPHLLDVVRVMTLMVVSCTLTIILVNIRVGKMKKQ